MMDIYEDGERMGEESELQIQGNLLRVGKRRGQVVALLLEK